jgi:D-aminoacyl-tRNA deacylase
MVGSAKPDIAKELYHYFVSQVQELYVSDRVKDGVFQAMMQVSLVNDGPVTLEISTDPKKPQAASATPSSSGVATPNPEPPA